LQEKQIVFRQRVIEACMNPDRKTSNHAHGMKADDPKDELETVRPLQPGIYLGFYVSGNMLVRRASDVIKSDPPSVVTRSVAGFFKRT
jgi:hypothetical protein